MRRVPVSTLLSVILDAHPDVMCGPELNVFAHGIFWSTDEHGWRDAFRRNIFTGDLLKRTYMERFKAGYCPFVRSINMFSLAWYGRTEPELKSLLENDMMPRQTFI